MTTRTKFMPTIGSGSSGSGQYFRMTSLKEGPAKLRLLSTPITGYEGWTASGKPVRAATMDDFSPEIEWRVEKGKEERPKFFVAFFVWNHAEKKVQVLSLTQRTVMQQLDALDSNDDWGDPREYDITISRTDSGDKVSYTLQPSPKKPLPAAAATEWQRVQDECVGLEALYHDGHPLELFGTIH